MIRAAWATKTRQLHGLRTMTCRSTLGFRWGRVFNHLGLWTLLAWGQPHRYRTTLPRRHVTSRDRPLPTAVMTSSATSRHQGLFIMSFWHKPGRNRDWWKPLGFLPRHIVMTILRQFQRCNLCREVSTVNVISINPASDPSTWGLYILVQ